MLIQRKNRAILKNHGLTFLTFMAYCSLSTHWVKAETCIPLNLVGGKGTQITKTVSQPTIPGPFGLIITRNNWNTDWAVPGGRRWEKFIVNVTSETEQAFDVRVYLKYADQTAQEFYNQSETVISSENPLTVVAAPQTNDEPYQVNLFIGDPNSMGKTYTASVSGCY